jgi:hypothetical protein
MTNHAHLLLERQVSAVGRIIHRLLAELAGDLMSEIIEKSRSGE